MWIALGIAPLSAVVHLYAHYRGPRWLVYVAKPLTTICLIVAAVVAPNAAARYQIPIVIGLALSLAGDVFLMLPGDRFLAGLASFLAAHVAYIAAFSRDVPIGSAPALIVPYLAAAIAVLTVLWPRLGRKRVPVALYVAAIVLMAWQATARAALAPSPQTIAAAWGAALFVVSDGTLAIDRFRAKFAAAQVIVMTTYVAAQWLIAWSVAQSR